MKALIVYYSMNGNTEYAARKIAERTGAETLRLEPVKAYPDRGVRKFLRGGKSAMMEEKPELRPYRFEAENTIPLSLAFLSGPGTLRRRSGLSSAATGQAIMSGMRLLPARAVRVQKKLSEN